MRKIVVIGLLVLTGSVVFYQCKSIAKAAVKHWTKQQIAEFTDKCKKGTLNHKAVVNSSSFCNCATETIMEKHQNYDEVKDMRIIDLLREAGDCNK